MPAICIDWGPLADSGNVARNPQIAQFLDNAGWRAIGDDEALAAFSQILVRKPGTYSYLAADWRQLRRFNPALARAARFLELAPADIGGGSGTVTDLLANGDRGTRRTEAEKFVRAEIARILRIDNALLEDCETLDDAGLDSLSSLVLRSSLENALGLPVPARRFTAAGTIGSLSDLVCALIDEVDETGPGGVNDRPQQVFREPMQLKK